MTAKKHSATTIVERFLERFGPPEAGLDEITRGVFTIDGKTVTHRTLTHWVWDEFHIAPRQADIRTAYDTLAALTVRAIR